MVRDITQAVQTEIAKSVVRPIYFVALYFTETLYLNSADRDLGFGGNTYIGVGNLGKISVLEESSELQAFGMTMEMSGIQKEHVSLVLNEKYQGKVAKVWLGFLNAGYALVNDPVLMFDGFVDQMSIKLGRTATILLSAESKLIRWEIPKIRRYTNSDQQTEYPGDKGLEFVNEVTGKEIIWGQTT